MHEQSKSAKRRFDDGNFHNRYFIGNGIDIGCGVDNLGNLRHVFRGIQSVRGWDMPDGDAQFLEGVDDNTFDFAVSSHCLEHMVQPTEALINWIRVVKPGGHIVVTIPEEEMYEQNFWPSRYNDDHKWSFTLKQKSVMPKSVSVLMLLQNVSHVAVTEKIEVIRDFYYEGFAPQDQTLHPCIESCIEFILRKV